MSRGLSDEVLKPGDTVICIEGGGSRGVQEGELYTVTRIVSSTLLLVKELGTIPFFIRRFTHVSAKISEPSEDIYNDLI